METKFLPTKNRESPLFTGISRFYLPWVPGRTRTVDIQNHKQVVEFIGLPVFIGILAFPYFAFAPILRRIFAESFFSKFQMRYDFLFSRGCLFPLFAGTIFKSDAKIGKKFNIKNDFAVFFQKKSVRCSLLVNCGRFQISR